MSTTAFSSVLLFTKLRVLSERHPELARLLGDRADAVVVGGWVRDTLLGQQPMDIDIMLTRPEPYQLPGVVTEYNKFGGQKFTTAGGLEVDFWHGVTGMCAMDDPRHMKVVLPLLVQAATLTCQQCAFHYASGQYYVAAPDDLASRVIRKSRHARVYGLDAARLEAWPIKVASLQARGWELETESAA